MDENDRLRAGTLPDDPEDGAEEMAPPADVVAELRDERARHLEAAGGVTRKAERMGIDLDAGADPFENTWRTVDEWRDEGPGWLDLANEPPPRAWLLRRPDIGDDGKDRPRGLLPRGKVGMLVAAGGVGKTMALCELALAVATERAWLDALNVETPGRVLLALGEEDAGEARRRLWRAAKRLSLHEDLRHQAEERIVLLPLAGNPEMALTQEEAPGVEVMTSAAHKMLERLGDDDGEGWALVILDPASRFAGPEIEKDAAAATRFVQVLERLAGAPGAPTVLVAHHTSQDARKAASTEATSARGSTALSDSVRWQAGLVSRPGYDGAPDLVDFAMQKNNYAPPWPGFTLLRESNTGVLRKATAEELEAYDAARVIGEAKKKAKKGREKDAREAGKKAASAGKADKEIAAAVTAKLKERGGKRRGPGKKREPLPEFSQ